MGYLDLAGRMWYRGSCGVTGVHMRVDVVRNEAREQEAREKEMKERKKGRGTGRDAAAADAAHKL